MPRTSIPLQKPERLQIVDVLRGFALSALFLVHMLEGYELYWIHPDPSWASKSVFLLFMGKSFPLLSIGFGFSFYILIDRPGANPSQNAIWFAWRLLILEIIGCAHALIYSGDIIEVLATVGLPLILVTRIKSRWALVGIAAICFLQPLQWWDFVAAASGVQSGPSLAGIGSEAAAYLHGDLVDVIEANMWAGQITKWHFMLVSGRISQIFGLYIVGLLLGRINFFSRLAELRRARALGLVAALAVMLALHFARTPLIASVLDAGAGPEAGGILSAILEGWEDLAATACWALAICVLWHGPARMALAALANVGRATLTLYILQSLIFIPLLYPFGANLYAVWSGPMRLLVGLTAVAFQVGVANLWFRHFRYGPIEWAWRAATDLRWDIPFRRSPTVHRSEPDIQATANT